MNGVVHVGAHRGEEVPQYVADGRSPVILFEPQPLSSDIGGMLVRVALSDYDGKMTLRIPHHLHVTEEMDTMSASGFPLNEDAARANGWTPTQCECTEVEVSRFDTWARREGFDRLSCDLLVIDVQGMELQVLEGFGDYLDGFTLLEIECSEPPLYVGGASASEVVKFLSARGFSATSPVLRHGDVYFARVNECR